MSQAKPRKRQYEDAKLCAQHRLQGSLRRQITSEECISRLSTDYRSRKTTDASYRIHSFDCRWPPKSSADRPLFHLAALSRGNSKRISSRSLSNVIPEVSRTVSTTFVFSGRFRRNMSFSSNRLGPTRRLSSSFSSRTRFMILTPTALLQSCPT